MKKKFLIALFIVVMLCLLSFSVSAANEVTLVGGEKADFTTVFTVNSNNVVTGFNGSYSKNDVTDIIFPDEITGIECNMLFNVAANLNTLTFEATDTFFISGDGIFSECSVKTITFNPDCVVELRKGNFSGCASLTQITFPKFKVLAGSAFKNCSNMTNTNDLVLAEGMTKIGGHVFNGCTSLDGTVYFPSTLETIEEYSFQNTGFEYFDLSKCVNLSSVGGGYGGPFTDNDKITTLDLSACVNLKALKKHFAANCDNLTEVILPPNLTEIPYKAFAHCYKLQSIVLPASVTYVADEAFHSARKGQTIMTFTVYIQSAVEFHETYPFRDSSAKIEFVLFGDNVTVDSFKSANTYSAITGATVVDYLDSDSKWTYSVGGAITNHTIVENYCTSLALTKKHSETDEICGNNDYCKDCEYLTCTPHTGTVEISYPNGYSANGQKRNCTLEICNGNKIIEIKPIFVTKGYSNSKTGIAGGYTVNIEEYNQYEDVTGKKITFGLLMLNPKYLDGKDSFFNGTNVNIDGTKGFAKVDMTNLSYENFTYSINGFNENVKDIDLIICAYAYAEGEAVEFIQHQATACASKKVTKNDATLYTVTFNSVKNRVGNDIGDLGEFVIPSKED